MNPFNRSEIFLAENQLKITREEARAHYHRFRFRLRSKLKRSIVLLAAAGLGTLTLVWLARRLRVRRAPVGNVAALSRRGVVSALFFRFGLKRFVNARAIIRRFIPQRSTPNSPTRG